MPRNSGGTYTRVSNSFSNPITGTTISPTDADTFFDDVETEITDSLSRSGKGPMLAPLPLADGTAATPGLAFGADTDTGLYRISSNSVGVSVGGTLRATWTASGVALTNGYTLAADSVAITGGAISGITDLAVVDGGTGASSASAARTNLGLVIGGDVQGYHARLADIAGIGYAQGDVLYHNGSNLVKLAAGTTGQFLKTQGAGANPVWATLTGGGDLLSTNNLSDVASTATAFANIKQAATDSVTGVVELATDAETATGTDTSRAVTPANIASAYEPKGKTVGINTQTDSYTLALADAGKIVEGNKSTAMTITVPANTSVAFTVNTRIDVVQYGLGQVSLAGAGGVNIRSVGGKLKLATQYSSASLYKRATDEWVLVGDLVS
jgi:hypothetical protein